MIFKEDSVFVLDKPPGMTSQQAVTWIKKTLNLKKGGHTGTLDPLATGVLIILTGKATKLAQRFSHFEKEYIATLELGKTSDTYDIDGQIIATASVPYISMDKIRETIQPFIGDIIQTPPPYSAKKVKGKRLYWYARRNITVKPKPHPVTIHAIEVAKLDLPFVEMSVVCSTGTYIRSLIQDIGILLGCGAIMTSLRRTKIGPFKLSDSVGFKSVESRDFVHFTVDRVTKILDENIHNPS